MRTSRTVAAVVVALVVAFAATITAQAQSRENLTPRVSEFIVEGYPPLARQARVQGDVTALVRIGEDGTVSSISQVAGPAMLRSAADNLKNWRFDVQGTTSREVHFTMRFILSGSEDVRNLTMRVKGRLPNLVEITANPTSEKPGPDVRR
jgi:outer membrane biosynthesis protein TonB